MLRILRAFAWLRWRILLNSLERTGSRDTVERFSVAIEQLGPIIAALVMAPSALALATAGAYSGWALAHGHTEILIFTLLRFVLLVGFGLAVLGPIILNILAFHAFITKGEGLFSPMLIVIVLLALYLLWVGRKAFTGLLN